MVFTFAWRHFYNGLSKLITLEFVFLAAVDISEDHNKLLCLSAVSLKLFLSVLRKNMGKLKD